MSDVVVPWPSRLLFFALGPLNCTNVIGDSLPGINGMESITLAVLKGLLTVRKVAVSALEVGALLFGPDLFFSVFNLPPSRVLFIRKNHLLGHPFTTVVYVSVRSLILFYLAMPRFRNVGLCLGREMSAVRFYSLRECTHLKNERRSDKLRFSARMVEGPRQRQCPVLPRERLRHGPWATTLFRVRVVSISRPRCFAARNDRAAAFGVCLEGGICRTRGGSTSVGGAGEVEGGLFGTKPSQIKPDESTYKATSHMPNDTTPCLTLLILATDRRCRWWGLIITLASQPPKVASERTRSNSNTGACSLE